MQRETIKLKPFDGGSADEILDAHSLVYFWRVYKPPLPPNLFAKGINNRWISYEETVRRRVTFQQVFEMIPLAGLLTMQVQLKRVGMAFTAHFCLKE